MAGIGFRLQKLLLSGSYTDLVKAYLFSSVIAVGPMIVVMAALGAVKHIASMRLGIEGESQLMGMVVYVYAFSMLGVSPFLFIVTRYLADQYYLKEFESFSPCYLSVMAIMLPLQLPWLLTGLAMLPTSFTIRFIVFGLYMSVSGIWMAMMFLSAARSYVSITLAFLGGGVLSIGAAYVWGLYGGLPGCMAGFALGQFATWMALSIQILREFGLTLAYNFSFLRYFSRYPMLAVVGFLYYFGIWIDKFIFWGSPQSVKILGYIHISPNYDTPMFLAYLTVVPSLAFFLIQMETSFANVYRGYFDAVRQRKPLEAIEYHENRIADTLSAEFQRFSIFQGVISGVVILLIYYIAEFFNLDPVQVGVLRVAILGAYMQIGYMMILNFLFYFDAQKEAVFLTLVYAVGNGVLSYVTLQMGLPAYGFGYVITALLTLIVGFILLDRQLRRLTFNTFMKQPVLIPKFKLESDYPVKEST